MPDLTGTAKKYQDLIQVLGQIVILINLADELEFNIHPDRTFTITGRIIGNGK